MGKKEKVLIKVVLLNLILLIFRYLYIIFYPIDLAPDEALYWEYSRHLDISYYSKPPLAGYLIALSTGVFGDTEFGVRFFPPLLAFFLSFVVYKFSYELFKDEELAFKAFLISNLSVGFNMNSILMTIDAPFIFFYSLSLYLTWKALKGGSNFNYFFLGLSIFLALLSKYTAVFLPITLLTFRPRLISSKTFWWINLFLVLALTPVLVWNYEHDFVGFKHLLFLAGARYKDILFTFKFLPEFLGGQLLILSVIPFFFMVYGWYKALKNKDEGERFLTFMSLPVFLFFLILSFKTRVYANWSAFPYMAGIILGTKYMGSRFFKGSLIFGLILNFLLYFYLPPQIDIKKRVVGWEELGRVVSSLYKPKEDFIIAPSYQLSAELAFYTKGHPKVYCINLGRRMNDYDIWKKEMVLKRGSNGIFITYALGLDDRVREAFDGVILKREFTYRYRGKVVRKLSIYKLRGFKGKFREVKPESF